MNNANAKIESFSFDKTEQKVNGVSFNMDLDTSFLLNGLSLITEQQAETQIENGVNEWKEADGHLYIYIATGIYKDGNDYLIDYTKPYLVFTKDLLPAVPTSEDRSKIKAVVNLTSTSLYSNAHSYILPANGYFIGNRNVFDKNGNAYGNRVIRVNRASTSTDDVVLPDNNVSGRSWKIY